MKWDDFAWRVFSGKKSENVLLKTLIIVTVIFFGNMILQIFI